MIALENHKLLILTPPKCGSTSLHAAMCNSRVGGFRVIGPQGDNGEIEKHTCCIPYPFEDWRRVMVVRHPIDRAWSLWQQVKNVTDRAKWSGKTFDDFAHDGILAENAYWFFSWTLKRYWDSLYSCMNRCSTTISEYWQLEHIETVLENNGIQIDLGKLNVSRDKNQDISCETLEKLVNYYKEDFSTFGY